MFYRLLQTCLKFYVHIYIYKARIMNLFILLRTRLPYLLRATWVRLVIDKRQNCPADAKFWVGAGPTPSSQGIRVPDENGKEQPLRRYDRKTIVLTLPGDLTVHQLGHFGVWCEAFAVDFGHVQFPLNMNIPPSLKMLGVSPQVC